MSLERFWSAGRGRSCALSRLGVRGQKFNWSNVKPVGLRNAHIRKHHTSHLCDVVTLVVYVPTPYNYNVKFLIGVHFYGDLNLDDTCSRLKLKLKVKIGFSLIMVE